VKKRYLSWQDVQGQVTSLCQQIAKDDFRPDYVIGLTRGGLLPATMISHWLGVPMHALGVSLRDDVDNGCESNLWMAEDAYAGQRLLIVDDINDSGATLKWIHQDWSAGCHPTDSRWDEIWNFSVRHAVLINNAGSQFSDIDYAGESIDKRDQPEWIVFPWEDWWTAR
jgi:hypoxanthine phosphoribosyltransferase